MRKIYILLAVLTVFSCTNDKKENSQTVTSTSSAPTVKSGKTYSSKISMTGNNQLNLRGYIGVSLFGRTETWTRAK